MPGISWYTEFRGAAGFWIAALVFALVGAVFAAIGVLAEEFFLFIGLPFLGLGLLVLALMIYSLHLKVRHPEKYSRWLWWVNFVGGLFGALLFAIPSTFVLPFLLLADGGSEFIWLGALFTIIGVLTTATIVVIAVRQYKETTLKKTLR